MQEQEKQASVPYFVHEGTVARMERIITRLTKTIVAVLAIAIILFIINNVIWMRYVEQQKAATITEGVQDAAGVHQQSDGGPD